MPAEDRYTGEHIAQVKLIARESKNPFYILSGKYGLIFASDKVPYYDYYLEDSAVEALIEKVFRKIQNENITEIEFYSEDKPTWAPYKKVIEDAAKQAGISLSVRQLLS